MSATQSPDAARYEALQREMDALASLEALDTNNAEWNERLMRTFGEMEAIKNRNRGYAPGTEPKE
jgi:hypothetical protein